MKIILAKKICTMAEICTRIVQNFLAPKWHHYLLQNLYQTTATPGISRCVLVRTHPSERESHITQLPLSPPLLPPQPPPPQTMSASEASDDDDDEYAPGHMPVLDF